MSEAAILEFFATYAYQPHMVYLFIVCFMTASSFGLPIPEEMILISAGLVAFMAEHPALYPPPTPDAQGVNLVLLAVICFVAVLGSDLFIYFIGRVYGKKLVRSKFFTSKIGEERFQKINEIFNRYSYWACGIFRFTPGVRFPGHMTCGLMGVPLWQFLAVDGTAALISVPTQVYLVATYGEVILDKIKEFKIILFSILAILFVIWSIRKLIHFYQKRTQA